MFNIEINYEDNAWKNIIPEIEKLIQDRCERAIVSTDINKIIDNIEISILLCNDDFIQDLNQQYRNQDKPTNVFAELLHSFSHEQMLPKGVQENKKQIIFLITTSKYSANTHENE